jgi:hypothetical protein
VRTSTSFRVISATLEDSINVRTSRTYLVHTNIGEQLINVFDI